MFVVGGFYLAFFFIISHNFKGVYMFNDEDEKTGSGQATETQKIQNSFLHRQVLSSSNVGGNILCFINGGLNYQIEHHLFPRIQHCHYPTIAPIVREYCRSKGIPYVHFPTVWSNVSSCIEHLCSLGNEQQPVYINRPIHMSTTTTGGK